MKVKLMLVKNCKADWIYSYNEVQKYLVNSHTEFEEVEDIYKLEKWVEHFNRNNCAEKSIIIVYQDEYIASTCIAEMQTQLDKEEADRLLLLEKEMKERQEMAQKEKDEKGRKILECKKSN